MAELTWVAGSRESALALVQTHAVMAALQAVYPEAILDLKTYKTLGDRDLDRPLAALGDKGIFVKELETALLCGEIDFAVHSMKDMAAVQPEGLSLVPFGQRETPLDAFVSNAYRRFNDLPAGAVVGTSSVRRQAILQALRPELTYKVVRGNVQTRIGKLDAGEYDAIILAAAGLVRLDLQARIQEAFLPEVMLPPPCQGTLGVEFRTESPLAEVFARMSDTDTIAVTLAERGFMTAMQGGCQVPMGAYARPITDKPGHYVLDALIFTAENPMTPLRTTEVFTANQATAAGQAAATGIRAQF